MWHTGDTLTAGNHGLQRFGDRGFENPAQPLGAVFTNGGDHELDAAVMNGANLEAGALAGVRYVRNPVLGARAVLEHSEHVLLAGKGADAFLAQQDLEHVANDWFSTPLRRRQLEAQQQQPEMLSLEPGGVEKKFGTVGAVALDRHGHVAAATSTGGITNKRFGRVGDSPLIGAGTWADDRSAAISATGHGEYFIRCAVAVRSQHANLRQRTCAQTQSTKSHTLGVS